MQENKIKMAILIDEYGGVSGLVTMENLIEEIVGDIHDEYDEVEEELIELESHVYRASGGILLYDLDKVLHKEIESACDTLSGYLMEQLGYIPDKNQLPIRLEADSVCYTILSMDGRVIKDVKVMLKEEVSKEDSKEE